MKFIPYKPEHAKNIFKQGANGCCDITDEEVDVLSKTAKLSGDSYTALQGGRIVACGGYEVLEPEIAQAWFLCVNDILPMEVKDSKRKFLDIVKGFKRVQTPLRNDFPTGIKFAEFIGFGFERIIPKFHTDGTDALMYILGGI